MKADLNSILEKRPESFLISIFISAEVPKGLVIYPGLSRTKEKTKQNMRKENPRKKQRANCLQRASGISTLMS